MCVCVVGGREGGREREQPRQTEVTFHKSVAANVHDHHELQD